MKIKNALGVGILIAAAGCSSAEENPFIAARADAWRTSLAADVPAGTELQSALAFFEMKGLSPWYVETDRTLYAPDNIEPEPRSLLPFDAGLIKSYDIRCRFSDQKKLVACSVVPSTKRWVSGKGPN